MTLAELKDGQEVRYPRGRPGEDGVIWNTWSTGTLYVRRVDRTIKSRGVVKGQLAILAIRELSTWAEYNEDSWSSVYRVFECEGYYLQIEGLT